MQMQGVSLLLFLILFLLFSLSFLPPAASNSNSDDDRKGGGGCCRSDDDVERREKLKNIDNNGINWKKKVLGSRPPSCVNKCMKCKPCKATLVIPPHHHINNNINYNNGGINGNYRDHKVLINKEEDDTYYLLSWKCTCGHKLFQP